MDVRTILSVGLLPPRTDLVAGLGAGLQIDQLRRQDTVNRDGPGFKPAGRITAHDIGPGQDAIFALGLEVEGQAAGGD